MRRRRTTLGVECVEARDLPSGITAVLAASRPSHPSASALVEQIVDPPPFMPGPGDPLPRGLARERFRATFSGPFRVGPPLFTGQSKILFFQGTGTSNQFLHGDYQMAIILPTTNDPIKGGAYLQDRNLNSGGVIAFDLEADPQYHDRWGRPTRLNLTTNSNIFSGIYYDPQVISGTVQIRYGKNSASVLFQGLIFASGITNPLRNQNLY
jgi:hypothetical protein